MDALEGGHMVEMMFRYILMLDFDHLSYKEAEDILIHRSFTLRYFGLKLERALVYKTLHGWHIILHVLSPVPLDDTDICFIQLCLGDDYKRAIYNWPRAKARIPCWNTLFSQYEQYQPELSRRLTRILSWLSEHRPEEGIPDEAGEGSEIQG